MGRDKAMLEIGGVPVLVRIVRLAQPLVGSLAVIAPAGRYEALALPMIADDFPGAGPLGGLATALRATPCEWSLVLGCDMPYLCAEWFEWLIVRALTSAADALAPETPRGLEPLCAMYRKSCTTALRDALARGERKLTDAVAALRLERIAPAEWARWDPNGDLLASVNTPEDYRRACERLGKNPRG